ncbi:hypothetical protein E2C01_048636 [Portunus trituberculatus]|uniref:Uncharacterized protein n=1 Tax=Portunus trituberculatus TaxID=210409 RepID=A0A5B7G3L4_PORTR|nr:hypothetical protein [Portunus trituberculatus]
MKINIIHQFGTSASLLQNVDVENAYITADKIEKIEIVRTGEKGGGRSLKQGVGGLGTDTAAWELAGPVPFKRAVNDGEEVCNIKELVDKLVSVESGRRPCIGSNTTMDRLETSSFVEWFKVTYMSP